MSSSIAFEFPKVLLLGLPLAGLLGLIAWRQRQRGFGWSKTASLLTFRGVPLFLLLFLAARPVKSVRQPAQGGERPVVVLVDSSKSMSIKEPDTSRYDRALDFLGRRLLPAMKAANLPVQGMLFAQAASVTTGEEMSSKKPEGRRTNLGGAIAQAMESSAQRPLAIIALTDGIANDDSDNARAIGALSDGHTPFIGVGFGSDEGIQTLSLRRLDGPAMVAPKTRFTVSAELETLNADQPVACELVLYRNGHLLEKKSIKLDKGCRSWVESFQLSEADPGAYDYTVQLLPPNLPNLKCVDTESGLQVRICDQQELRGLYVQGALTWDYKFIGLALRYDPTVKITGLTRTSQQSVFRQNVEGAGELINGFPTSLEQFAPYRVVVLSDLRPEDLSPAQQELLARFCGELGGGVLMLGGAGTFDRSWQNSLLEQMLPVVLAPNPGNPVSEKPFHIQLTAEAAQNPIFQLAEDRPGPELWSKLPPFQQYGRVDSAKLGAQVWMVHPDDHGPQGHRILMASQRYGSGRSAVICLENFWRWRLAKDCEPAHFDRFWRQLFRWLGGAGGQEVSIEFADQELRPGKDIQILLRRTSTPQNRLETNGQFLVQIQDPQKKLVHEESMELLPSQEASLTFHPAEPALYTVRVLDPAKAVVGSRAMEIRDADLELTQTARNMETLRQWAVSSGGLAFKVEECPKAMDLVAQIKDKIEEERRVQPTRQIAGINGWTLSIVLGCLTCEWFLRKRWAMV